MAEAIARSAHADTGWEFASAGIATVAGRPPTPDALAALAELGIDASDLRSKHVDGERVQTADRIYGMEPSHVEWVRRRWPDTAGRVALLDPTGAPIHDPYGRSYPTYVTTRDRIVAALARRAVEWTPTLS